MLVVHPSSNCDVCLDAYVWDEETTLRAPYAIPCGHIFCRQCLESIEPNRCPLCRKSFAREHIKKLHMDPPENPNEHAENTLMQRMIAAWDEEVEMVNVIEEVEAWLGTVESPTLSQLKNAQSQYHRLKTRRSDDRRMIHDLQKNLRRMDDRLTQDKDLGLAVEASLRTEIESLNTQVKKYEEEIQSLHNEIARLEFSNNASTSNSHTSRKDKGKGRAVDPTYLPLHNNPLPAPPAIISGDRYASRSGSGRDSGRDSTFDAGDVARAIEASLLDRSRPANRDGYDSSGAGPSSAGPSSSSRAREILTPVYPRPIDPSLSNHQHRPSGLVGPSVNANGIARSSSGGSSRSQPTVQTTGIIGYTERYMGTPNLGPRQDGSHTQPGESQAPSWVNGCIQPPEPVSISTRSRRSSSAAETVPPVLNTAVAQAQQHASRASPSRRTKIVPGAANHERIAPATTTVTTAWLPAGSQTTIVNGVAALPTHSVPNGVADTSMHDADGEEPRRRHHYRRHKSRGRHRHDERAPERDEIPGVLGLGLIDENIEEPRGAAYLSGYMEGLGNGFEYGSARVASTAASSATRARLGVTEPRSAPATSAAPPMATASNRNRSLARPSALRRSTVQNGTSETGAIERLHSLMEDPPRSSRLPPVAENRASFASTEAPTWGTPSEHSLSRRESTASDVLAGLSTFPAYEGQVRSSVSSDASLGAFPASGPLPSAPAIMSSGSGSRRAEGGHEPAPASHVPSQTYLASEHGTALSRSLSYTAGPDSHSISTGRIYQYSTTPTSSQPARRSNDHQISQAAGNVSGRSDHRRLASLSQLSSSNNNNHNTDHDQESRGGRSHPARMATLPFPNSADMGGLPHNPLPAAPAMVHHPSATSIASAPPHAASFLMGPALVSAAPGSVADRLESTPGPTPLSGGHGNALGLDLGDEDDVGYNNPIPAFAAPTPRVSHGLFLRSFSYDSEGEGVRQFYR